MKKQLPDWVIPLFWLPILFCHTLWAKPIWKFTVVVAVEKQTADFYQTMLSKDIKQIVGEQMSTVNANFNRSDNFKGIYNFQVDSIYVFDGPAIAEILRPHPHYNYCVVIDGFSVNAQGGGWLGDQQVIYHKWPWSYDFTSGPFGSGATDGLTHEFGHSRGAIDIYGLRVEGSKNPVNGETFEPVNSIMNFPYGNIVWDEYTTNLLNSTADGPITGDQWIVSPFPRTMAIKTLDNQGKPLGNVALEVYPVDWFSYAVNANPVIQAISQANGTFVFPTNPYQPPSLGYPWHMRYGNFLIKATYNSTIVYKWMPLYDVQNSYFRDGVNSAYNAEIRFAADMPIVRLTGINSSTFCGGSTISVSFMASGPFEQDNSFMLQVVDSHNNTYGLTSIAGSGELTLSGTMPDLSENTYTIRVAASKPNVRSDDYLVRLNYTPRAPAVQSVTACQHEATPVLQVTGQNLMWYTTLTDSVGSVTTPVINTDQPGQLVYYVSQTLSGCESPRAALAVTINPLPSAPGVTPKTICQFAVPELVVATGTGLKWYRPDGSAYESTPVISTDSEATLTYRVTQTINGCESPKSTLQIRVRPLATATLAGSQTILEGQSATMYAVFTGDSPWLFSYHDSTATGTGAIQTMQVNSSPYALTVKPARTTAYYLTSVSNGCGSGRISGSAVTIQVTPLLGIDDPPLADVVTIFPVPATNSLTVQIPNLSVKNPALLELANRAGQTLLQSETYTGSAMLNLEKLPAGTYVLTIRVADRILSRQIIKF